MGGGSGARESVCVCVCVCAGGREGLSADGRRWALVSQVVKTRNGDRELLLSLGGARTDDG